MLDLQDKVADRDRSLFNAMLRTKELPDALIKRYIQVKTMTDRIDARLTAGDLARVALDSGFNPETGKFEAEKVAEAELDVAVKEAALDLKEKVDQEIEKKFAPDLTQKEEPAQKLDLPTATNLDVASEGVIDLGDSVTVLDEGEIKSGKISGMQMKESGMEYQVDLANGETITADEDQIEVQ